MELRFAVVDDRLPDAQRLESLLRLAFGGGHTLVCDHYESGDAFLQAFPSKNHQVVFLDICMEGTNGIETARILRRTDPDLLLVFVTSSPEYVWDAFPVHPFDYLLKPYNEQELVFAVEDAIRQVSVQLPARPAQPPAPAEPLRREEDEDMRTAIIRAEISRFIDAHYGEDISMQDAAAALRYSDAYFCKLFKQCFKVNFSAYLNEYRVNKARQLILDPRLSLKDIGAAVGYSDANYFTRVFKRLTGQTPSEYRMAAAEKAVQG